MFIFIMVCASVFFEEVCRLGYIYHKRSNHAGTRTTVVVTSAFHASCHPVTVIRPFPIWHSTVFTVAIFCAGLIRGILRYRDQSLVITFISHLLADPGIMLICSIYIR